ncbi:MAG TPA: DinB family protein [Thermoanaerobaculia bacterium]|nr:DinB family protein [Thermoanaerobaculia bacterium]
MLAASTARELLLYMLWADRLVLAAVRNVREEDLTRDAGVSFKSILGTLAHILGSERMWLSRFLGVSLDRVPSIQDFPDLMSWITGWEETASQIEAFLAGLTDEQLATPLTWTNTRGESHTHPLWHPVSHMVNHATYHRGQVVSLLRQMEYPVPTTDLIVYFYERAAV